MRKIIKKIIIYFVDEFAKKKKYHFPATFLWNWKLSQLMGVYELETTLFFRRSIKKGMTVVDIGANIGYFTRLFSLLVGPEGKVYAFEPDEKNFDLLKINTSHLDNVHLINSAVSDINGNIDFFHVVGATGTHSLLPATGSTVKKVSSVTLDQFFDDKRLPDMIKIDVEGAENQVFRGMDNILKKKSVYVIFEYQPTVSKALLSELSQKFILHSISLFGNLKSLEQIRFRKGKVQYANVCLISRK